MKYALISGPRQKTSLNITSDKLLLGRQSELQLKEEKKLPLTEGYIGMIVKSSQTLNVLFKR